VLLAERAAVAAIRADSEDPWAHHALGNVHLFTRRFDDSLAEFELALQLNPNFSLAQAYYGLTLSYCGRWQDADLAIRFPHFITASRPTRSSMDATMRTPCGSRGNRFASGAISSAVTGCSPPPPEWLGRPTRQRPPCRSFAAPSRTSHWRGLRTKCHSSTTPI